MNRIYKIPKGTEVYTGNFGNSEYTRTDIDWYVEEDDIVFGRVKCNIFSHGSLVFLLTCDIKDLEKYNHE